MILLSGFDILQMQIGIEFPSALRSSRIEKGKTVTGDGHSHF